MPRGDKRGPNGMGPMTGRGLGYCAGYDGPGFTSDNPPRGGAGFGRGYGRGFGFGHRHGMGFGPGSGFGRGRGFGRGWGYGYRSAPGFDVEPAYEPADRDSDLAQELAALREQIKDLEKRLNGNSDQD